MIFFSSLILITASIISYFHEPAVGTIIPRPEITIPVINTVCAIVSLSMFFVPNILPLEVFLAITQAISTTLTGYETLGTFLYSAIIIILFCNGYFKTKLKQKIIVLIVFWFIVIQGLIPFGLDRYFLEIAVTLFFGGFYFYIYLKLADKLSTFVPAKIVANSKIALPPAGTSLNLKDYEFSDRQITLIKAYLEHGYSYTQLGQKFNLSTSTVKKAMSEAYPLLGVKNLKELHILLLQYEIQ